MGRGGGRCGWAGAVLVFTLWWSAAWADEAPDALSPGPYESASGDYRYDEQVWPVVLSDRVTDLAGRIYWPAEMSSLDPLPVVVIIPGNTATCTRPVAWPGRPNATLPLQCDYTMTGRCRDGWNVVQSYRGYGYLGHHLASWGYVVVSVDANRGISCGPGVAGDPSLNLARGRQVLFTLQQLYEWHAGLQETPASLGVSFRSRLDLSSVGLVGHSRGGEGVRTAIHQHTQPGSLWAQRVPGLRVRGVFELAGSDGQSRGVYDASGVPWVGLVCGCDGDDVTHKDVHPYDRMIHYAWEQPRAFKAVYVVHGANHNFLNTEWVLTDTIKCRGAYDKIWESTDAASTAMRSVVQNAFAAFFRTVMGPHQRADLQRNFNPLYDTPGAVSAVAVVTRSYAESLALEDVREVEGFTAPTGTSQQGEAEEAGGGATFEHTRLVTGTGEPRHDPIFQSNLIEWRGGGFYADRWAGSGRGLDLSPYNALSFRIAQADHPLNTGAPTDFYVSLLDAQWKRAGRPARLSSWALVEGPVAPWSLLQPVKTARSGLNPLLQTVLLPLDALELPEGVRRGGGDGAGVSGVRFDFDDGSQGAVWVASFRFENVSDVPQSPPAPHRQNQSLLRLVPASQLGPL